MKTLWPLLVMNAWLIIVVLAFIVLAAMGGQS